MSTEVQRKAASGDIIKSQWAGVSYQMQPARYLQAAPPVGKLESADRWIKGLEHPLALKMVTN